MTSWKNRLNVISDRLHLSGVIVAVLHLALLTSFFSSCSGDSKQFKIEGQFKNMNQGELYIYDIESGHKDTIEVRDGRFSYLTNLEEQATLVILFPNYSELPVLARGGEEVTIEGDVTHLKETKVSGNDENEELTALRHKISSMLPEQAKAEVRKFIVEHPESPSCHYLLRRFFIVSATPDYKEALNLCVTILKKQPKNLTFIKLRNQLKNLTNTTADKLPDFTAISSKGDTIQRAFFDRQVNVIHVWNNWDYDTQTTLTMLHRLQREHPDSIAVMTISMDVTPKADEEILMRDSITWPNICDGQLWQSHLVPLFGITTMPYNIVADKEGHIVDRNLKTIDLEHKIESLLEESKR